MERFINYKIYCACLLFVLSMLAMKCENKTNSLTVSIENSIFLKNIPSGSGMSYIEDSIYIISDDSPYLFQLNNKFDLLRKITLTRGFENVSRIEKPLKPDYESLAIYESKEGVFLYGFGSGSLAGKRDSLVVINTDKDAEVKIYELQSFYQHLEELVGGVNRDRLNIEGAVIHNGYLYLLNRGNNAVLKVGIDAFNSFIKGEIELPALAVAMFEVSLPKKEGMFVGFSGCAILPGSDLLVFTATVENTTNWVDDGEILGSYIGVLSLENLDADRSPTIVPFEINANPLLDKVESITITGEVEGVFTALAVADNDDGSSKIFSLKISYK